MDDEVRYDLYFDVTYGGYGAMRVEATYDGRVGAALVIGMMIVGQDKLMFRIKTQRPEAKKMFAYMIIEDIDKALSMAMSEAELAAAGDFASSLLEI